MAKKSTQTRSKAKQAAAAEPEVIVTSAPAAAPVEARSTRTPKTSRSQVASEKLEEQYSYIVGDLRRVLILAAIMFALLIAVNVVLSLGIV